VIKKRRLIMLKNIPKILSPELLSVLCEMGHNDVIVLGDGNFPGSGICREGGAKLVRADGLGVAELLDAILTVFPLDAYVETPVSLMELSPQDKGMDVPIWKEIEGIVVKHEPRGPGVIGHIERFKYYDEAKKAYAVIQTGEGAIYANVMLRKGVVK
jgi:L-fucose mutarotase